MNANETSNEVWPLSVFLCRRIEKVAAQRGLSFEEAMEALLTDFFAKEVLATEECKDVLLGPEGVSHQKKGNDDA